MLWRTHVLAGINSLWLVYPLSGALTAQTISMAIIMASFGALLPDIDAVDSKVQHLAVFSVRPFVPIAGIMNRIFGHRGLLHSPISLIMIGALACVLSFWIGVIPGISLLLGYGSHLAADGLTRTGISVRPMGRGRLHLLPARFRVTTGSRSEDILLFILGLSALALLLHYLPFAR